MDVTLTSRLGRGRTAETLGGVLRRGGVRLEVAVKRPLPELCEDPTFVEAFLGWGRAQRDLEHVHVVEVLDVGTRDDRPCVIQERVSGASLADVLAELNRKKRALRPELAFTIAQQLAEGVAHVTEHLDESHGGIDPSEVLLGFGGEVKIGDQRLRTLDRLLPSRYQAPATYRAPEHTDGADPTPASDVYALGLVFLEMLIGQPVWTAESMTVQGTVVALKDFSHVGQAQPALTEDLVTVLGLCLEPDPAERLPDARRLLDELLRVGRKHALAPDPAALGGFVRALLPRPAADEAPTMLVPTDGAVELDLDKLPEVRAASVLIDPELQAKALRRASSAGRAEAGREEARDARTADRDRGRPPRGARPPVVRRRRGPPADPATALLQRLPGGLNTAYGLLALLALIAVVLLAILVGRAMGR
jgi:hypothetical protein